MYKYICPVGVSVGYSTNVYCELSWRNNINIFPIVFEFVNSLMRETAKVPVLIISKQRSNCNS